MNTGENCNTPSAPQRVFRVILVVGVFGLSASFLIWYFSGDSQPNGPSAVAGPSPFESPYRNTRPGVKYVADEVCATCHRVQAEAYHQHPMGRSLAPVADSPDGEWRGRAGNVFSAGEFRYEVRREAGKEIHCETRLNQGGQPVLEICQGVKYAVGSGARGRSYLIDRDGHLFLSPLSWYAAKDAWDLSPGYEKRNSHFNRPVTSDCLYCHANRALPVEHSLNRYQPPIFQGYAIGCQRCHGPGELHVKKHESGEVSSHHDDAVDDTIVNPTRLSPERREAVCQQCHLSGVVRVERIGRRREEYRPGLRLSDFVTTFVATEPQRSETKFVGHVEQMYSSRCFQRSEGRMGCVSCHDPHGVPSADERIAYFRGRCMTCHSREEDCSLAIEARRKSSPRDNCALCHMPRRETEIRHAATTDHRIPRRPEEDAAGPSRKNLDFPIAPFHTVQLAGTDDKADRDFQRDLGVALIMALDVTPQGIEKRHVERAVVGLQAAVEREPGDLPAWEALGRAQAGLGRLPEALRCFQGVLAAAPEREFALTSAASLSAALTRPQQSLGYWRKAVDANPSMVRYRVELARSLALCGQWETCRKECHATLKEFPDSFGARQYLVESCLALGRHGQAEREFEAWMKLDPPQQSKLREWFRRHPLNRPRSP